MPGDRQHEIHHRLQPGTAQVEDAVAQKEQPERRDRPDDTQDGSDPEHRAHVPNFRPVAVADTVVGNGQDRTVVE